MNDHPDLDALSASLDGEQDAAVAGHVAGCGACREQRSRLDAARAAVARPTPPPDPAAREAAIARALAAADGRPQAAAAPPPAADAGVVVPAGDRARSRWWLGVPAAAAVLVAVVGATTLLGRDPARETDAALRPTPEAARRDAAAGAGAGGAGSDELVTAGGDLGDVATLADLRARVAGATQARAVAPTASAVSSGPAPAPGPAQVGTRACELQARAARPDVGLVVYAATARFQGTPAVVLGFGPTPGGPPTVIVVLAEQGCALLAGTTPS